MSRPVRILKITCVAGLSLIWNSVWTLFLIRLELKHYTAIRHTFLLSRAHARLAQARTVLITNVPDELCDKKELMRWASFVPGGVQNVWIYRDTTVRYHGCNIPAHIPDMYFCRI